MTTINIDITNNTNVFHPDDRVVMYAPEVRARIGGGLVSTAPSEIPLTNGQATITNFEPGPVLVRFECLGIADTTEKLGIVPDSGVWSLDDVISGKLTWTPPVVSTSLQLLIDQANSSLDSISTAVEGEMGGLIRSAEAAATTATQAATLANERATSAETKIDAYTPRVEALEALGGLSPQSPVDGQTANLISQTNSLTHQAVADEIRESQVELDVRDFGEFSEGSSWQVIRDTMQAANDYAAGLPGGAIINLPPGKYQVKGVYQDSHVTWKGNSTTLEHPDGLSGHMIIARSYSTTGTIAAGSFELTVASAEHIEPGTVVAITGGRGMSDRQNALLSSAIDASQATGITLADPYGFPLSGHMTIGTEIIKYTGITAGVLQGVTRGMYGTTPAPHGTTGPVDAIGVSAHHIAQVTAVAGTSVTLDRPAPVGVAGAPVEFGIVNPGVYDLRIEGNRNPSGQVHYPVWWATVGNGHGDNFYAYHAQTTIFLGLGATGNRFGTVTADSCLLRNGIGASFWMFQSCRDNVLQDLRVTGEIFIGVYIDDRTTVASPYDGPGEHNHVGRMSLDVPAPIPMNQMTTHTIGLLVSGGLNNSVGEMWVHGVRTGIVFEHGGQFQSWNDTKPECRGNVVSVFRGDKMYQPWVIEAPGNAIISANFKAYLSYGVMTGNPYVGHMIGPNGEEFAKLPAGTYQYPSLAFRDEPGTGIYRPGPGMWQVSVLGKAALRVWASGLQLESGRHILFSVDGTGDIGGVGNARPRDVRAARLVVTGTATLSTHRAPDLAGAGAMYYNTDLKKPLWSDGVAWRDAMGNINGQPAP